MIRQNPLARARSDQTANRREPTGDPQQGDERLPDAELLELAHRCVEDEGVIHLLLAQPSLPSSILLVLAERLPAASFHLLATRHGLPEAERDELAKRSRTRPHWWQTHMASMMR